jgi:phenylalanine-4-hydroxylase
MDMRTDTPQTRGAKPVTYGASDRPPRGDYSLAGDDYTCDQFWERYTPDEHARYAALYARQMELVEGRACREFIDALSRLGSASSIPRFSDINTRLKPATGWELVAVPGLIPEYHFFALLAQRRFPVTHWLRRADEFDYIVEPDLFHDLFGHVPLLFNPVFADYMQAYGQGGLKAERLGGLEYLSRLYWYTVEFGLIRSPEGLRAYGAGILSSAGELDFCVHSPKPKRVGFDLARLMRTRYKIDTFQETYFVIDSFEQLFEATAPDFAPLYASARHASEIPAGVVLPGETQFSVPA